MSSHETTRVCMQSRETPFTYRPTLTGLKASLNILMYDQCPAKFSLLLILRHFATNLTQLVITAQTLACTQLPVAKHDFNDA